MVFLLFLLGLIAIAAGVMGLATGTLPIAEATFGVAALVSASIAVTGGLVLLGMAAAVAEVRRVLRQLMREMRQDRVHDRMEGGPGAAARREPRLAQTQPPKGNVADVIPARFDVPEEAPARPVAGSAAELRRAVPVAAPYAGEPRSPSEVPEPRFSEPPVPQPAPAPQPRTPEPRFAESPAAPPPPPEPRSERRFAEPPAPGPEPRISQGRFAEPPPLQPLAAPEPRISERRRSEPPDLQPPPVPEPRRYAESAVPQPPPVPEPRTSERRYAEPPVPPPLPATPRSEPAIAAPERFDAVGLHRPGAPNPSDDEADAQAEGTLPPLAPVDTPRPGPRPVRILKSGVINEVAYTLFSDGTIESKTPTQTLHFASIDEFRRHLEGSD